MQEIDLEKAGKLLQEHEDRNNNIMFKHIPYKEKMEKSFDELMWTNPTQVIKWGWKLWDDKLWWIYWGKIYAIWWVTWIWKSSFINCLCNKLSMQWIKITKYSLEDRMEDIWKEDLFTYTNKILYKSWQQLWKFPDFMNNEYTHVDWKYYNENNIKYVLKAKELIEEHNKNITELDKSKQVTIEDMVQLMEQEAKTWTKVFFIDHLHYFKKSWWNRADEIETIMHDINEVARKFNVAIFLLAHYRKLNKEEPSNDSFKDASWIMQVANIIIHISRDAELTKFSFWKIRWKIKCKWFMWNYDIATDSYLWFFEITD